MNFRQNDEAIAPVIGTILMIGLVGLAAVFVALGVGGFFKQDPDVPGGVMYQRFTNTGEIQIIRVPDPVVWSDLEVTGCAVYPGSDPEGPIPGELSAGDVLSECVDHVSVKHRPTGALILLSSL